MKIIFQTRDGLSQEVECPGIEEKDNSPYIMRPMFTRKEVFRDANGNPKDFGQYRRYSNTGLLLDGVQIYKED